MILYIGFVFGIASTGCKKETLAKEQLQTVPLMRGTLWWISGERVKWSKERFAKEIQAQRDVGFDLLWVFNTPKLMDMAIKADAAGKSRDVIGMIYEIADEKGMRVIADLPKAGWYGKTTAREMMTKNKLFIEPFHTRYGAHPSFYGWYLNHEINPIHPSEEDKSRFWRQTWKGIVAECHRVAPDSVVTISPFFLQPSVFQGLSSFRRFVKVAVQTKNPASVFSGTSFWNYTENLWHCWPPVQFDRIVNGRPTVYMGHHVKEEKDE